MFGINLWPKSAKKLEQERAIRAMQAAAALPFLSPIEWLTREQVAERWPAPPPLDSTPA